MWKNIKKFFKWIADHTGISWIAGKISSGWKWLFSGKKSKISVTKQNTSQQEERSDNEKHEPAQANDQSKDHTTPKTPAPSRPTPAAEPEGLKTSGGDSSVTSLPYEPLKTTTQEPAQPTLDEKSQKSVVNKKEDEFKLNTDLNGINLSSKQALMVQSYKSHNVNTNKLFTELLIYIKCDKDEYRVVGSTFGEPTSIFSVPIVSIVKKNENGEYLDSNIKYPANKDVQEMLGLKDDVTTVKVDSISGKPFEASTLGQPNTTKTEETPNSEKSNAGTKEIDNLQASASDSTPGSSFYIVSSQATTPDELQELNEDKELAKQPEADQKGHVETKNGQLELVVSQGQESFVKENKNPSNEEEYLVYIACDTGNFRITCVHHPGNVFRINSVKPQSSEENVVAGALEEMQKLLGIDNTKEKVEIYNISRDPITPARGMFKKVCQTAFLVQLNFQSIRKENAELRHS